MMTNDDLVVPQEYEPAYPIEKLEEHPDNYRIHDEALLDESIGQNGFYGVVTVQKSTGLILAGHGRWNAMRRANAKTIPVIIIDVDDETADRILAVDNRAQALGGDQADPIVRLLSRINERAGSLLGTGFEQHDFDSLMESVQAGRTTLGDEIAFTEERDAWTAAAHADKTIDEYRDAYVESATRSLVLDYPLEQFRAITDLLPKAREIVGVDTNADLVAALIGRVVATADEGDGVDDDDPEG